MKIAIFFMALLTLSAATIATVSIAPNVSLPVPTDAIQAVLSFVDSGIELIIGDPVDGGGGGPG